MLTTASLYIGASALIALLLFANVSRLRIKHRSMYGDADRDGNSVKPLRNAVRAHGNFVENAPFQLLVLAALELNQLGSLFLHILGAALLFSRLGHAFTVLNRGPFPLRALSVLVTWAFYAIGGVLLLSQAL